MKRYIWNILIALDQLLNALTGGNPDDTLSYRAAINQDKAFWRWFGAVLEYFDPGHLAWSLEGGEYTLTTRGRP